MQIYPINTRLKFINIALIAIVIQGGNYIVWSASYTINKIGTWGSYLEEDHTLRHFKSENWYPDISCRKLFEMWSKDGSKDALTVAGDKVQSILSQKPDAVLDHGLIKELERIIDGS